MLRWISSVPPPEFEAGDAEDELVPRPCPPFAAVGDEARSEEVGHEVGDGEVLSVGAVEPELAGRGDQAGGREGCRRRRRRPSSARA